MSLETGEAVVEPTSSELPPDVLVVEDSATERERLRLWLGEHLSFRVRFANDVASAERQIAEARPDCVLLDQVLPDGTGTELLITLRRRHPARHLPVILTTGVGSEEIAVRALEHGASDYLIKRDSSPERLQAAITNALERAALERRIAEGTTQLMRRNRELEEARRQLEASGARQAALQAERDMLYQMVIHDLRSPINVISGASRELEDLVDAPEAREMLTLLERATGRLEGLSAALSDLVETERGALRLEERNLGPIVTEIVEELEREAANEGVRLRLELGAARAPIDAQQLARLVTNLLSNAVRHARAEVTVKVRTDGSHATIEVVDDGPGVPSELRDRLFQLGVRGDRAGSFGLGLAIVRRIAEQHGGTAAVADVGPPGACFRVKLPAS